MTQTILLQSLTEIVTLGLLFMPSPTQMVTPPPPHTQSVLQAKIVREPVYYDVKPTDTLDSIAKDVYGNEKYWTTLWNDNEWLADPAIIHSGDKLLLRGEHLKDAESLKRPLPTPTITPTLTEMPTPTPNAVQSNASSLPLDQIYKDAGRRFGVPWQILYAIHFVETGQRDGPINSGFGPEGPMQFLPSTFGAYATDGNGDGVTDINSAADAIYTAANFIARHGSLENGLKAYGNTSSTVMAIARSRGW